MSTCTAKAPLDVPPGSLIKRLEARDCINGGNDGTIPGATPRSLRRRKDGQRDEYKTHSGLPKPEYPDL